MRPFFSIIIPVYNSGHTIANTLDSVVNQCFSNYEILIIDGCSVDDTIHIAKQYVHNNISVRVKIISEKDKGVYDAMNKGISIADGEWLYFLGSDDSLYDDNVLQDIYDSINGSIVNMVYGNVVFLSNNYCYGEEYDVVKLHNNKNICHQAIFYHKDIFKTLGKYSLSYKVLADWEFNIRCFRHPDIEKKYINRNIALYNDVGGISSVAHQDALYDEIAVRYKNDLLNLQIENYNLIHSREYKIGKSLYSFLKRIGIIYIKNKFTE